jgi:hypothetical protein
MDDQDNKPALFADHSQELMAQGDAAAVARSTQEIQAALVIAQRFPRDEIKAEARIMQACSRKGLAEVSEYEFSKGGTRIVGPTIDLIRAIANRWGNLLFGWSEVERNNGQSQVRCWAWDTQSNSRAERTFYVRHWRDTQGGGYALEDEREIYELLANMASRRVRACLEEVIDADIIEKAVNQCRKTLREGQKLPIKDRAAQVIISFQEYGVSQEMIEARLGNKMDAVSENQLASLRRVYKSLKDGVGQREDYFKPSSTVAEPKFGSDKASQGRSPETANISKAGDVESPESGTLSGASDPNEASGEYGLAPEPEPVVKPEAPKQSPNNLRLLRDLCRVSKVKEGALLAHLSEIGLTDGSAASLDELQLSNPAAIEQALKSWAALAPNLKGVK